MSESNQHLRKIILFSARPTVGILLSDLIRYETATGDRIGKDIALSSGKMHPNLLLQPLKHLYPVVTVPAVFDEESSSAYLKDVAWTAASEVKDGNTAHLHDLFVVLELVFTDGNQTTEKLGIDFLEDIQTLWVNLHLPHEIVDSLMLSQTKLRWNEIERFWKAAGDWAQSTYGNDSERTKLIEGVKAYL